MCKVFGIGLKVLIRGQYVNMLLPCNPLNGIVWTVEPTRACLNLRILKLCPLQKGVCGGNVVV